MRSIAEGSGFGLFALTKPVIFRLGAIESERLVVDSHLGPMVGAITKWLSPTPTAGAPHIRSAGFAMILEGYFVVNVARFWGVDGTHCLGH